MSWCEKRTWNTTKWDEGAEFSNSLIPLSIYFLAYIAAFSLFLCVPFEFTFHALIHTHIDMLTCTYGRKATFSLIWKNFCSRQMQLTKKRWKNNEKYIGKCAYRLSIHNNTQHKKRGKKKAFSAVVVERSGDSVCCVRMVWGVPPRFCGACAILPIVYEEYMGWAGWLNGRLWMGEYRMYFLKAYTIPSMLFFPYFLFLIFILCFSKNATTEKSNENESKNLFCWEMKLIPKKNIFFLFLFESALVAIASSFCFSL